jgi:hypothetical protein
MTYQQNKDYRLIADKRASKQELLAAVRTLHDVVEPPSFWSDIANDAEYSSDHQRICIFQLFSRHVHAGMTLLQLAAVLNKPRWLKRENIMKITSLYGKVPVLFNLEDSIFAIRPGLPPENYSAIYLRIRGKEVEPDGLFDLLKGISDGHRYGEKVVLEVGDSEVG